MLLTLFNILLEIVCIRRTNPIVAQRNERKKDRKRSNRMKSLHKGNNFLYIWHFTYLIESGRRQANHKKNGENQKVKRSTKESSKHTFSLSMPSKIINTIIIIDQFYDFCVYLHNLLLSKRYGTFSL